MNKKELNNLAAFIRQVAAQQAQRTATPADNPAAKSGITAVMGNHGKTTIEK